MKPFKSFLTPQLNDYLAYREGLGYAPQPCTDHLLRFDRYLHQSGADLGSLHPSFFLHMRTNLNLQATSLNHVLCVTRGFFRFLVRRGIFEKNPLLDIPPLKEEIVVPFIFSPEQTDQLLSAICKRMQRTKASFLKEFALYMVILARAVPSVHGQLRERLRPARQRDRPPHCPPASGGVSALLHPAVLPGSQHHPSYLQCLCCGCVSPGGTG